MNLLKFESFKIDYNSYIDRINVSKDNDWIGISPLVFSVWMTMLEVNSQFEKIIIKQDGSQIEIIKLLNNSLLTLTSKAFVTSVAVTDKEYEKIRSNIDIIKEKISKKTSKKVDENDLKRVKATTSKKRKSVQTIIERPSAPAFDLSFFEMGTPPPPYGIEG